MQIRLFGPLELAWDNQVLALPSSARTRSLLAYLIFHHDRPVSRDRLAGTFWPERPDARARRALSNGLWQIRRALGPTSGYTDTLYPFSAVVTPTDTTTPITYTWSPPPDSGQGSATVNYTWGIAGSQVITLTAENCGGTRTAMHAIEITAAELHVYLPLVVKSD